MCTTHVPVPEQALPFHPVKAEPFVGVAVKVTVVPRIKSALQLAVQFEMPPGELLTVPVPLPMSLAVRGAVLGGALKLADTVWAPFITTTQEPVPEHAPDQPAKVEPPVPFADKVTETPLANSSRHVVPQSMPEGLLVMTPLPAMLTDKTAGGGGVSVGDGVEELPEPEHADKKTTRKQPMHADLNIAAPAMS